MKNQINFNKTDMAVILLCISFLLINIGAISSNNRNRAREIICIANERQLLQAWRAYADDNDGKLVASHGARSAPLSPESEQWVAEPRDEDGNLLYYPGSAFQLEDKLRGIRKGKLYPYVKNTDVYHCPSDKRYLNPPPGQFAEYSDTGGWRTYSIPASMNGPNYGSPTNPMYLFGIAPVMVYNQIKDPAGKYVFLEVPDMRGYNIGAWVFYYSGGQGSWDDPLAAWHNNGTNIGFADGHVETHKWVDECTIEYFNSYLTGEISPCQGGIADLAYMDAGWARMESD